MGDKVAQQVFKRGEILRVRLHAHDEIRDAHRCNQLAVAVEIPVEAVGVNQIGQGGPVAFLLVLVAAFEAANPDQDNRGFLSPNSNKKGPPLRKNISTFAFVTALLVALPHAPQIASADDNEMRHFLFIGAPNAAAWKLQIDNPGDREASVRAPIEKLGGKLISYYWGVGNGRNYITVALPDDPTLIQAFYLTRLGDGLLDDYQMIELMTSADMATALERVSEVKAVDDIK